MVEVTNVPYKPLHGCQKPAETHLIALKCDNQGRGLPHYSQWAPMTSKLPSTSLLFLQWSFSSSLENEMSKFKKKFVQF